MTSKTFAAAALALALAAAADDAFAQTQVVAYEVQPISQISVSGTPSLTIGSATAGSAPTSVSANATWAVTTNETSRKVTAQIDQAMPENVTLTVQMAAPGGGATSSGVVALTTTAADVVTGISKVSASGLNITYQLSATAAAGAVNGTRTVTYTIVGGL